MSASVRTFPNWELTLRRIDSGFPLAAEYQGVRSLIWVFGVEMSLDGIPKLELAVQSAYRGDVLLQNQLVSLRP